MLYFPFLEFIVQYSTVTVLVPHYFVVRRVISKKKKKSEKKGSEYNVSVEKLNETY